MAALPGPSPLRVLHIAGLGSNAEGAKPRYLREYFVEVCVPAVKHASYAATKQAIADAVRDFAPDIVVAHSAGVGKALTLATTGVWQGPLVLLAGGNGCAPLAGLTGQAVTVVVPKRDPDAQGQRRAVRACAGNGMVVAVEVDDMHDLNASMVAQDRLRHLIVATVERQKQGPATAGDLTEAGAAGAEAAEVDASEAFGALAEAVEDGVECVTPPSDDGACPELAPDLERESSLPDSYFFPPVIEPSEEDDDGAAAESGSAMVPAALGVVSTSAPPQVNLAPAFSVRPGQLFTWGRGGQGQLGQTQVAYPKPNCALPHPLPGLRTVVQVSCGGGQQGSTAAVTAEGALFTFGNNFRGRLGHGEGSFVAEPRRVEALAGEHVLAAACGMDHGAALVRGGGVWAWGGNRKGQLGRGHTEDGPGTLKPEAVPLPVPATQVDCEHEYSMAVLADGRLFAWGCNTFGQLGLGNTNDALEPAEVSLEARVASVGLGSMYAGAVSEIGELFMWGYGGHGNLGLGDRKSMVRPTRVPLEEAVVQVACTRGQEGCKGGLNPKDGGHEGPHTVVLAASGALYTMGTCHKGLLCNLGAKDGAFGKPWDELLPYRVGGRLRNGVKDPPLSPLAVWPPPYDQIGPAAMVVSAHIHCAVVGRDGRAWAWGCGSNDGRCGVERFLNMKGEGKPPAVDSMKCYMMGPHRIGVARPVYWPHQSLSGYRVLALATGRNHMAAIAVLDEGEEPGAAEP